MIARTSEEASVVTTPTSSNNGVGAQFVRRLFNRIEYVAVAVVALFATALHIEFFITVGGLWRDEVNSVNLANLSSLGEIWHFLDYDSFPILYLIVLRAWTVIAGVGSDAALRALGLITGLALLGILFWNARRFGARTPLLSLALVGLNPMIIRYGDSIRAYGLGMLLILITLGSFWRVVETPSPSRRELTLATIFALLSVHCLFYNSVLLAAICAGAIAVALQRQAWRTARCILAIGAIAAVSLLPYLPMIRRKQEWTFLVSYPVDMKWLWGRVCEVIGSPDPIGVWLWTGLFIVALVVVVGVALYRQVPPPILFGTVTCAVAVPAYALFLHVLSYYTQPWYYITLVVLVGCSLDSMFGAWRPNTTSSESLFFPATRIAVAVAYFCLAAIPAWDEMPIRHTNVDLIATKLGSEAMKGDVIVATHWQYAVSLCRYYHGPAQVITLPFVEDHRFHRYDLALRQMESEYPLEPAFSRISAALQAGHRAFFVGALRFPKAGELPPGLSLGYRDATGTRHGGNYDVVWPISAGYFVQSHARNCIQIPVPVPNRARVQRYEYLALSVAEGWR